MLQLSIIIPIFNVEKYIVRCLNSILTQNINPDGYEIIIIDDESPDDSLRVAHEICANLTNITIISQKNKGLGGARNTGLLKAAGEYVWFVDSDDTIAKDSLSKILDVITTKSDIYVFDVNTVNNETSNCVALYHSDIKDKAGCEIINYFMVSQAWRNVYKKDFLTDSNLLFREHFLHEDGEFNMRAVTLANTVTYHTFSIYNYYINNNASIMNNIRLQNQIDLLSFYQSISIFKEQHVLNNMQEYCLRKYEQSMLGLLFKNVLSLNKEDTYHFKILLRSYKKEIYNTARVDSFWNFLKSISMFHFVSKRYYNLIYNKTLKFKQI